MAPRQIENYKEREGSPCLGKRQKLIRNRHVVEKNPGMVKRANVPKYKGRLTWNLEKRRRGGQHIRFGASDERVGNSTEEALGERLGIARSESWANTTVRHFSNKLRNAQHRAINANNMGRFTMWAHKTVGKPKRARPQGLAKPNGQRQNNGTATGRSTTWVGVGYSFNRNER